MVALLVRFFHTLNGYQYTSDKAGTIKGLKKGEYKLVITDSKNQKVSASIKLDPNIGDTVVQFPDNEKVLKPNEEMPLGCRIDAITKKAMVDKSTLPSPFAVLLSFKELHFENFLVKNTWISMMTLV